MIVKSVAGEPDTTKPIAVITATRSGALAIDRDSYGGNPFATALIKALSSRSKDLPDLLQLLARVTKKQSSGYQSPDLLQNTNKPIVPFVAEFDKASKVAMVMVYSDYSETGMQSLPGAEFDLKRIRKALIEKGFDCWALLDPSDDQLEAELKAFEEKSIKNEFAVLYVTGHGVEVDRKIYILPSSFKITDGKRSLSTNAFDISDFQNYLRARRGNFLFYGGCRNDPF